MASASHAPVDSKRKSSTADSLIVKLKCPRIREIFQDVAREQNLPRAAKKGAPPSHALMGAAILPPLAPSNADNNNSDSNPATPGTNPPMAPPSDSKKKGAKRSAPANGNDSAAKGRAKPGPKKKQKLEEGNEITGRGKLGPRANQGAINAGLRALDRTGTPCRKWAKGGFVLKSFTGVVWEIPRWKAPARAATAAVPGTNGEPAAASTDSSMKENPDKSEANSHSGADVEMGGVVGPDVSTVEASSPAPPAPTPVAAAS